VRILVLKLQLKDNNDGGPPSGGEFIIAISPEKISGKGWDKHADEFLINVSYGGR